MWAQNKVEVSWWVTSLVPDGLYALHQPLCEILLLSEFYLVISKLEEEQPPPHAVLKCSKGTLKEN